MVAGNTQKDNLNLKQLINNNIFIAYTWYIWWSFGYLGTRNRRPLLNCVVRKIRELYPDENNICVRYKNV